VLGQENIKNHSKKITQKKSLKKITQNHFEKITQNHFEKITNSLTHSRQPLSQQPFT